MARKTILTHKVIASSSFARVGKVVPVLRDTQSKVAIAVAHFIQGKDTSKGEFLTKLDHELEID